MNCPTCGHKVDTTSKLLIDTMTCKIAYKGTSIKLSPQQVEIVQLLRDAGPGGLRYQQIIDRLNGNWDAKTNVETLKVQKCAIMKLVGGSGLSIEPTYGRGYRLVMG